MRKFGKMTGISQIVSYSILLFFLCTGISYAQSLEQAKEAGQIGEKRDGYIGLVQQDVPPAVAQLVEEVNRQRRERYEQIAQENGISVSEVAQLAFAKAVENTRPGHYLESSNGQWVQKPNQ